MPSHPERVRRNYPECFQSGKHNFIVICDSDIAPFIMGTSSLRVTWRICEFCGERIHYIRTQQEFENEMEKLYADIESKKEAT